MPEEPASQEGLAPHIQPERTRIQLCGRLSVEVDGRQRADALRGKQVPLLLAYLVLNRDRLVGRDELSEALWPRRAPRSPDASLRTLLSRLRSALGSGALTGREQVMLELPERVWIDVEAAASGVERALEALERADAPAAWALAQVPLNISGRGLLPGAQAHWLEAHRRELEDLRLQSLEVIGRAGLIVGGTQLASVQRAARSLIEAEPYRESGYVLLMQALAADGNRAEGVRVFERLRTLLRDELGTTPSPAAIAAHERLLRPPRRPDREPARVPVELDLPPELGANRDLELIGRRRELAELARFFDEGHGEPSAARLALLSGEPGVGKSRLAAELARRLHEEGAIVLAGRSPQEPLAPYQPFLEALRHYISSAPIDHLRATVREHGGELQRLLPELGRRIEDLPLPPDGQPQTERYRLFEAVSGVLAGIAASSRLLLLLDELHWADRPTLLLLRHLARAHRPARMSILGVYRRSEAKSGAFGDALEELRDEQLVTEFRLAGLSEDETAQLIAARTGTVPPLPFVRALHAQTEGNPLFITQIVREVRGAGVDPATAGPSDLHDLRLPENVRRVIAHRLAGLGERTEQWLRVAAVIGRDFDATLVERVSPLDEDQSLTALEDALSAGVVVERSRGAAASRFGYSFTHVLIRETLYEEMSALRRAQIHRRVGQAIEQSDRADGLTYDERVAMLAEHFTRAAGPQDAEKAIRYAMQAAERATAMLAYERAAEHYARALAVLDQFAPGDEGRRLQLLLALGREYVHGGDRPLAWQPLREAADLAMRRGDAESLARAAVVASRRYVQQPGVFDQELLMLLERALEMTDGHRTTLRVRLLARLCGALYYSPWSERMAAASAEATEIATEVGDPEARALAAAARRRTFWAPSRLDQRLSDSAEVLRFAREAGDIELTLQGHAWLVVDLLEHGDLDAVDAQVETFTDGAERLRQPLYLWQAAVWRAMRALLAGRLEEADALAARALAIGGRAEPVTAAQYYAVQLIAIRRDQGRMGELESAVRQVIEQYPNRLGYRAALALLLSETGRPEEAQAEVSSLPLQDIPEDVDWLTTMTMLADLCADLGDVPRAEQLYALLLPYAEVNVVIGLGVVCEGAATRYLGRLAAATGRRREAHRHFEQALKRNATLGAPACLARTELEFAQALGLRRSARARELLDSAASTAQELGLPALARRASALRERGA